MYIKDKNILRHSIVIICTKKHADIVKISAEYSDAQSECYYEWVFEDAN